MTFYDTYVKTGLPIFWCWPLVFGAPVDKMSCLKSAFEAKRNVHR